jgi:hypothetical protein
MDTVLHIIHEKLPMCKVCSPRIPEISLGRDIGFPAVMN